MHSRWSRSVRKCRSCRWSNAFLKRDFASQIDCAVEHAAEDDILVTIVSVDFEVPRTTAFVFDALKTCCQMVEGKVDLLCMSWCTKIKSRVSRWGKVLRLEEDAFFHFQWFAAVTGEEVRILRVVSETLVYEVCKGESLRMRRRLEASMKWKSLRVYKYLYIRHGCGLCIK